MAPVSARCAPERSGLEQTDALCPEHSSNAYNFARILRYCTHQNPTAVAEYHQHVIEQDDIDTIEGIIRNVYTYDSFDAFMAAVSFAVPHLQQGH